MTPLEKCQGAAQQQSKTWDSTKTAAEMGLDCQTFHDAVWAYNGPQPEPPVDPIEPDSIGQDYIDAFTGGPGV